MNHRTNDRGRALVLLEPLRSRPRVLEWINGAHRGWRRLGGSFGFIIICLSTAQSDTFGLLILSDPVSEATEGGVVSVWSKVKAAGMLNQLCRTEHSEGAGCSADETAAAEVLAR